MTIGINQSYLQVCGDSQLVINQLLGSHDVKRPELRSYHIYSQMLVGCIGDITLQYVLGL